MRHLQSSRQSKIAAAARSLAFLCGMPLFAWRPGLHQALDVSMLVLAWYASMLNNSLQMVLLLFFYIPWPSTVHCVISRPWASPLSSVEAQRCLDLSLHFLSSDKGAYLDMHLCLRLSGQDLGALLTLSLLCAGHRGCHRMQRAHSGVSSRAIMPLHHIGWALRAKSS